MAERDCSKHTYEIRVALDEAKLTRKQHSNLIGGLLRQLADYTDGYCATKAADDAGLRPGRSMSFWFTSKEKQEKFDKRIAIYLRSDIDAALTRTRR